MLLSWVELGLVLGVKCCLLVVLVGFGCGMFIWVGLDCGMLLG